MLRYGLSTKEPVVKPFHLARSRTTIFFFWACSTANIQFPCQTYLIHVCCMPIRLKVIKTWAKGGAKKRECVGVFSLDAPLISRLRWVWLFPWKENNICRYTLTCSPSRTKGDLLQGLKERNILRPHRVTRWPTRVVQSPRRILGGRKISRFSRKPDPQDLFQTRCSLGSVALLRNSWGKHSGFMGWDPGIQGRERVLTDTVAAAHHAFLDLSFGLASVCCHSEKTHMFFLVLPHDGPKRPITSWPSNRIAWFWVSFQCHRTLCKSTFSLKLSNWTKNQPIALSCYDSVCPSAKGAVSGNLVG